MREFPDRGGLVTSDGIVPDGIAPQRLWPRRDGFGKSLGVEPGLPEFDLFDLECLEVHAVYLSGTDWSSHPKSR